MNFIKLSIVLLGLVVLCGCVFHAEDLKMLLVNKSQHLVYQTLKIDTVLKFKDVDYLKEVRSKRILSGDSVNPYFAKKGEGWKGKIWKLSKDSTLHIYFFNVDTVKKYGWQNIISGRLYRRMDFNTDQLDSLNWRVVYK